MIEAGSDLEQMKAGMEADLETLRKAVWQCARQIETWVYIAMWNARAGFQTITSGPGEKEGWELLGLGTGAGISLTVAVWCISIMNNKAKELVTMEAGIERGEAILAQIEVMRNLDPTNPRSRKLH